MLVILAPRWHWCLGKNLLVSLQQVILYETREYLPGKQRHLGDANKTNI